MQCSANDSSPADSPAVAGAGKLQQSPCDRCPKQAGCEAPCEKLAQLLDGPESGQLSRHISPAKVVDVDILLSRAGRLDARSEAVVSLYYRCGLSMERIARAFQLNRSSVHRLLGRSWRKVGHGSPPSHRKERKGRKEQRTD